MPARARNSPASADAYMYICTYIYAKVVPCIRVSIYIYTQIDMPLSQRSLAAGLANSAAPFMSLSGPA